MDSKKIALRNHNMFYLLSFRTTKKQVTGFSLKLVRYDITEKIYRSTVIVEELYKPKLFQRKEDTIKNGIDTKVFKKQYCGKNSLTTKKNQIFDIVNKPTNIVFAREMSPLVKDFLKKHLKNLDYGNIKQIDVEELRCPENTNFTTVSEVFYDISNVENFLKTHLEE